MENETQEQEVLQVEQKSVLRQVTPLSKYLAMALFIILPFVGGYIGYTFAPDKIVEVEKEVIREVEVEKIVEVPIEVAQEEDGVSVIFNRPDGWRVYALPAKEGDETIEYEQAVSEMVLWDNRAVYLHEDGFDPTQVRIKKYKQSAEATIEELADQNSNIEQIVLNGVVVTKIETSFERNDCSAITYVHTVNQSTSVGVGVSGVCPSHLEGYDELKISVAESVRIQ